MDNLARNLDISYVAMEYGKVVSLKEEAYLVRTDFGEVVSEKAVSCLVQPQEGDVVLLTVGSKGESFILSVLKRKNEKKQKTEITFKGNVSFNIKDGEFSLAADKNISLATNENMMLASDKVSVHANKGEASIEKFSFIGNFFHTQVKRFKMVAISVENICRRFTQRVKDSFRFVEDLDEVQTGSARYLVKDTLTMQSKDAVHMAEEIVTINAEQIHLG